MSQLDSERSPHLSYEEAGLRLEEDIYKYARIEDLALNINLNKQGKLIELGNHPKKTNNKTTGIYFLMDEKRCSYIGRSTNVEDRINHHVSKGIKPFNSYSVFECNRAQLSLFETLFIIHLQPEYNKAIPLEDWLTIEGFLSKFSGIFDRNYILNLMHLKEDTLSKIYIYRDFRYHISEVVSLLDPDKLGVL